MEMSGDGLGLKRLSKYLPDRADGVPTHLAASYAWRYRKARMLGRTRPQGRGPIVVGALGGSATRLVVELLRQGGVWMGDWVDRKSDDSLAFRVFLRRHFRELAAACLEPGAQLDAEQGSAIHRSFERSVVPIHSRIQAAIRSGAGRIHACCGSCPFSSVSSRG